MKNPLQVEQSGPNRCRWDVERSALDRRDPGETGSFRSLEEIVNRVYPQPEER